MPDRSLSFLKKILSGGTPLPASYIMKFAKMKRKELIVSKQITYSDPDLTSRDMQRAKRLLDIVVTTDIGGTTWELPHA